MKHAAGKSAQQTRFRNSPVAAKNPRYSAPMSSDQQPDLEDEIVGEFGDGHDVADIARRHDMTPADVYEVVDRAVGPTRGWTPPASAPPIAFGQAAREPVPSMAPMPVALIQVPPPSSWAVASLVFGIVGMLGGFCFLAIPCVAAIGCGHIGFTQTRDGRRAGHGMAVAGLVLGYLSIVPAVILLVLIATGGLASELDRIHQPT